ncbi:MAG: hypothetical protein WCB19_07460 [Thermoplasmata archaeon]
MSIYDVIKVLRKKGPMTTGEIQQELRRPGSRPFKAHQDITRLAKRGLVVPNGERRNSSFGYPAVVWRLA